jgi:hypothetical protein
MHILSARPAHHSLCAPSTSDSVRAQHVNPGNGIRRGRDLKSELQAEKLNMHARSEHPRRKYAQLLSEQGGQ